MKWMTQREAKSYATSRKSAIRGSVKHHQQLYDATPAELKAKLETLKHPHSLMCIDYCALCYRYISSDSKCPLLGCSCDGNCILSWRDSSRAFYKWIAIPTPQKFQAFKDAELLLLNKLKSLE